MVTTDGAAAMTGRFSGVASLICQIAPHALRNHCMIHRESLASHKFGVSEQLSTQFSKVLKQAVTTINAIRANVLNTRLFRKFCEEEGTCLSTLLFHAEVRWLSRGKTLERLYNLKKEVGEFLSKKIG